jgi:hypothetical protein
MDRTANKHNIGGYRTYCTADVKKYLAVSAIASYPVESYTLSLMEDDRFLLNAPSLTEDIRMEQEYLASLPDELWDLVASRLCVAGFNGLAMKDLVFHSLMTAMAFLHHNSLSLLQRLPLSLTQGSIKDNLAEFQALPLDANWDLMTTKIWHCTQWDLASCERNLMLLRDAPCSTQLCEKGHAAGSVIHRYHKRLGRDSLVLRSVLGDTRALFRPSVDEATELKLQDRLNESLHNSRQSRYSSAHVFNSSFFKASRRGSGDTAALCRDAAAAYGNLPIAELLRLQVEAGRERSKRNDVAATQVVDVLTELKLLQSRRRSVQNNQGVVTLLLICFAFVICHALFEIHSKLSSF